VASCDNPKVTLRWLMNGQIFILLRPSN
jgi:hypothetical protein